MITFKQFIAEREHDVSFDRIELTVDEAIHRITTHCKKYLSNVKRDRQLKIWRGDNNTIMSPASFGNSNHFVRKSANTQNWYNLWIDNSKKWIQFPDRLSSYICSTSRSTASNYGDTNIIFPYDDAEIGVAPKYDMWYSFDNTIKDAGYGDVDSFMLAVKIVSKAVGIEIHEHSFARMAAALKEITVDLINSAETQHAEYEINRLVKFMKRTGCHNLYELFDYAFDPDANNFSTVTPANVPSKNTKNNKIELWVQGACVFINLSYINHSAPEEDAIKLQKFFDEHNIDFEVMYKNDPVNIEKAP